MGFPRELFFSNLIAASPKVVYGKNYDYKAVKIEGTDKYDVYRRLTDLDPWEPYVTIPSYVGIPTEWEIHDTIFSPTTKTGKHGARRQIYE